MSASADFDMVIEESHRAVAEFAKGNPEPLKLLFSHREDATLANPFGPPVRGFDEAAAVMDRAASFYRDGEVVGFERVAKNVTAELAYTLEVERFRAKMGGSDEMTPVNLRVTSIFRPEDGTWKIVHRHADAITTAQAPETVIQR